MAGFSRGMQQKVALARALLHEPAVLFLDEPTTGLDPLAARAVRELIVGLKHASRSIVLCTHDLDEAERLADVVAILRQRRVVACDTSRGAARRGLARRRWCRWSLAAPCPPPSPIAAGIDGVSESGLSRWSRAASVLATGRRSRAHESRRHRRAGRGGGRDRRRSPARRPRSKTSTPRRWAPAAE